MASQVLYTVLMNDYEPLNELPEEIAGSIPSICFTDNPELKSSTWNVVVVTPRFPSDLIRSARLVKILGHELLEKYEQSLYIDNSVTLVKPPDLILNEWLETTNIAMPTHSFRQTVSDEIDALLELGLDSRERLTEQRKHYLHDHPDVLAQRPLWTAMIAREMNLSTAQFFHTWAEHVLRYSRRDQVSVLAACEQSKIRIKRIELDNASSPYHRWPNIEHRKTEKRFSDLPDYKSLLDQAENELADLQQTLQSILRSRSWKITSIFRKISENLRSNKN